NDPERLDFCRGHQRAAEKINPTPHFRCGVQINSAMPQPWLGCNTRNVLPPLDQTSTSASCPLAVLLNWSTASEADCTACRLTSTMMSPRCSPALSAGLPGCTFPTIAPRTSDGV